MRLGYRRVTIEDVARQAGIGKGTVYLHFPTKEALFLAVLLRIHHGVTARMVARMEADPAEVLPGRLTRSMYLDIADDPVTRPLYLGDGEVLGRLAHEAVEHARRADPAPARGRAGLVRAAPRRRAAARRPRRRRAALPALRDLHRVLLPRHVARPGCAAGARRAGGAAGTGGRPRPPSEVPAALGGAAGTAPAVAELYRSLIDHIDEEWRSRLR